MPIQLVRRLFATLHPPATGTLTRSATNYSGRSQHASLGRRRLAHSTILSYCIDWQDTGTHATFTTTSPYRVRICLSDMQLRWTIHSPHSRDTIVAGHVPTTYTLSHHLTLLCTQPACTFDRVPAYAHMLPNSTQEAPPTTPLAASQRHPWRTAITDTDNGRFPLTDTVLEARYSGSYVAGAETDGQNAHTGDTAPQLSITDRSGTSPVVSVRFMMRYAYSPYHLRQTQPSAWMKTTRVPVPSPSISTPSPHPISSDHPA